MALGGIFRSGMRAYFVPLVAGILLTVSAFLPWVIVGDAEVWRETIAAVGIDVPAQVVARLQDAESGSSTVFLDRRQLQDPEQRVDL